MRRRNLMLVAAILACSCSCSTYRTMSVTDITSRHDGPAHGRHISGYSTPDGRFHRFEGYARGVDDSVLLWRPARPAEPLRDIRPAATLAFSRADVSSVRAVHPEVGRSILLGLVLTSVTGGLIVAAGGVLSPGWAGR